MEEKQRIETPFWDLSEWPDQVYEPREDTFLLLDALEEDLEFIRSFTPLNILEIGSGSGVIITALASVIKNANCMALDINPYACLATKKTASINSSSVNVIQSDLVTGLKHKQLIDVLVFNPPYVPSVIEEEKDIIDKAWAGSSRGRSTTDRLFPCLPYLMSFNCVGYIVALDENDPEEMCSILKKLGFIADIVKKRKVIGEKLSILRFVRKKG